VKGGLSEVCVVASMIFGGIPASSVADTSAIGSVLIPEMEEKGYPRRFAAGVTVAASTMGMIIPPSIPMLTYAMISGGSVAALFLAGLVPGIMIGVLQIGVSLFLSHRAGYLEKAHSLRRKTSLLGGIPALVTPIIIIGSVTFGIATAIGICGRRRLLRLPWSARSSTANSTGSSCPRSFCARRVRPRRSCS
jgi:tripartite ATP-independent transporter DctM subunit